ncbi:MAG: 50S ribosomal protein L29 [Anaerolineae bacterium]|nr:50S ribosomal protein L29 [Anaerolineae bacterium]
MTEILELRDMSDEKLDELLEDRREELFNYRFQRASGRLEDYTRLKKVRRDIAKIETVLHQRWLAVQLAAADPGVAPQLAGQEWTGLARFQYRDPDDPREDDNAWAVRFVDKGGQELAKAIVNLNAARPHGRRARAAKKGPQLVKTYSAAA